MLNHVTLLGRLAQDPELRTTTNGTSVTSFDLAVNNPLQGGEAPPDYIPVVCWSKTAEFANNYLGKGRQIVVEGRITTRKWTDSEGKNRKAVEVTASRLYFADSNKAGGTAPATPSGDIDGFVPVPDEDLPF